MATNFQLTVEPREGTGTGSCRRLRRAGKVPGVLYGGDRDNLPVSLEQDQLMHSLDVEAFHSAIITLKYGDVEQDVVLRAVDVHPYKRQVLHVDLQRVSDTETLRMSVPVHLKGGDDAPGIKNEGGIMSTLINDVEVQCLPRNLPEYLEIDVSDLEINQSKSLSDLVLPEGVELVHFLSEGDDLAVAMVSPPTKVEEEVVDEDAPEGEGDADASEGDGDDDKEGGDDDS